MASKELFSLGKIYPSDFLKPGEQPRCEPVELKLMMKEYGDVMLDKTAPKEAMWGKYWYRSGINVTMKKALKDIVDSITPLIKFNMGRLWLDIASNDGTLLSFVPNSFIKVGIDPADDNFKKEAEQHADTILQDYFSAKVFKDRFKDRKASVITSIAMFYDLENPEEFIKDVDEVLDDNGLWVMQLSYSPLMIKQLAFDNICHEHFYYYYLFNLTRMLRKGGFKVVDCQLNDVNGGSFRVYIMKQKADITRFGTQPYRDVCNLRVESLLDYEIGLAIDEPELWESFFYRVNVLKKQAVDFIADEKAKGKTIWAYGASTKGNTLLQYFGLDNTLIDGIADKNYDKWGLRTVGTNIPIYSEEDMRKAKPDYLLILPWHFISEFKEREAELLKQGTKFIVTMPKFEIIE